MLQTTQLKHIKYKNGRRNGEGFGREGQSVCSIACWSLANTSGRMALTFRPGMFFFSRGMNLSSCSRKCTAPPLPRMAGLLSACFRLWSNMHDSSPSKPRQCVSEECWQECTIARSRGNTHPHGLRLTVLLLSSSYKDTRLLDSMNS